MASQSLISADDQLDRSIGPGGLVLVVSHLFAVPDLLWIGLEKSNELNLDLKNILAASHTKESRRCSLRLRYHQRTTYPDFGCHPVDQLA